jgi:3-oxoadipate enol-lactonase
MAIAYEDDLRIHYEVAGDADLPPLVLSNSLGTSLEMWEPQMPALASRFRVVRYDSRGHGASDAPPGPYAIEQLARDVLGLLDRLSIARAHFCGLSMGGCVGMWMGIHAPERLDRLVLANTGAKIGTADLWNARITAAEKGGMASIASGVIARWFPQRLREQPTPLIIRQRATLETTSMRGYVACCVAVRDMDFRRALPRIHVPTLVIAGTEDQATPPSGARFIAEQIPGSRYVELPAGHLSNIQSARAFTDAVVKFLSGRE